MSGAFVISTEVTSQDGSCGAYINAFVAVPSEPDARNLALREMSQAGWIVRQITRVAWTTAEDYIDAPAAREYFQQSLIDQVVLVVHSFPARTDH